MNKILQIVLVGTTLASTTIAIQKNNKLNEQEQENIELAQKLENSSNNYNTLKEKNKKLSKRVINEINKIISLTDSVKGLDRSLKEDQIKLLENIYIAENLNSKNKRLVKEAIKIDQLQEEISLAKKLKISDIETTLIRKKLNGTYTKTSNLKKIDAFKASFTILNNEIAHSGKRNIAVKVINSENQTLNYTNNLEIDYKNKVLDIVSLIEVEREKIIAGTYKVVVFIDGKQAQSSTVNIT